MCPGLKPRFVMPGFTGLKADAFTRTSKLRIVILSPGKGPG